VLTGETAPGRTTGLQACGRNEGDGARLRACGRARTVAVAPIQARSGTCYMEFACIVLSASSPVNQIYSVLRLLQKPSYSFGFP
jgi:hypothetical protein